MTHLYDSLAEWWPLISPPAEYAEEAALYIDMIRGAPRKIEGGEYDTFIAFRDAP